MGGYGPDGRPLPAPRDPLTKFFIGCAVVAGALVLVALGGAVFVGWRLTRDDAPRRPVEAFLLGDETRYWCWDLKPDDAGLIATLDRLERSAEAKRDEALSRSPFRVLGALSRRGRLAASLPVKIELAIKSPPGSQALSDAEGWSARVTVSRGILRMRAAMKIIRWVVTRDPEAATVEEVEGVQVTTIAEPKSGITVAMAAVGNRVLFASDGERVRRLLSPEAPEPSPAVALLESLHESVRLPGEDGWSFARGVELGEAPRALRVAASAASFDVGTDDALAIKVAVLEGSGDAWGTLSPGEALAIVESHLLRLSADAVVLGEVVPPAAPGAAWIVAARIPDLSTKAGALFRNLSAPHASEWPSATPIPPSPPPPFDPRSDTPGAPPHEGIPTPAR